jgi:putative phosphoesterase
MSRVAAIYDVHGNLPALEAVLAEIRREEVDEVVVGGDVLPGPLPRETLDCLLDLDLPVRFLRGNGDRAVLEERAGVDSGALPEAAREIVRWTARQITPEEERRMAAWPATLRLAVDGLGEVLFCHATPRNDTEVFTRATPEAALLPAFRNVGQDTGAAVVVCGHTHMPFDRTVGGVRVVNAGSVGMPYGEPGAYWLLLGPGLQSGIEPRRTAYDLAAAAARVRATDYPQAESFASGSILHPPSEAEMVERFSAFEIR